MNITSGAVQIEIDKVCKQQWTGMAQGFDDFSVTQTWSYGACAWGESTLSHVVLKRNDAVAAAAQVRIARFPGIGGGMAFVRAGPMWRRRGQRHDPEDFRLIVRALRSEYVVERGLLLRLLPGDIDEPGSPVRATLESEGFRWKPPVYRTILLDLDAPLEDLRQRMDQHWRRNLKRALAGRMRVIEGNDDALFGKIVHLHEEMVTRKGFEPGIGIATYRQIQQDLPETLKMHLLIGEDNGVPVCGIVTSLLGNKGIFLVGATGDAGLELRGSYLLHWRMIEWLKNQGAKWYDLGGINPEKAPGTYRFKAGLPGKDVWHTGQFEACDNALSALAVHVGEGFRTHYRGLKSMVRRLQARRVRDARLP